MYPAAVDVLLSIRRCNSLPTASGYARAELLVDRLVDEIWPEWQVTEANPRGVRQCVRQCRRHRVDRALAHSLGSQRPDCIVRVREENLRARDIGVGGNAVVA